MERFFSKHYMAVKYKKVFLLTLNQMINQSYQFQNFEKKIMKLTQSWDA